MNKELKKIMNEDLTTISVFWNNEHLGVAKSFKWKKGNKTQMGTLEITGKLECKIS